MTDNLDSLVKTFSKSVKEWNKLTPEQQAQVRAENAKKPISLDSYKQMREIENLLDNSNPDS